MFSLTYVILPKELDLSLMAINKRICSSILIILIALKVTSAELHIYIHHGHDDEHMESCELCEQAIGIQNVESPTSQEYHINRVEEIINTGQQENFYVNACIAVHTNNTLFGRPPPSII